MTQKARRSSATTCWSTSSGHVGFTLSLRSHCFALYQCISSGHSLALHHCIITRAARHMNISHGIALHHYMSSGGRLFAQAAQHVHSRFACASLLASLATAACYAVCSGVWMNALRVSRQPAGTQQAHEQLVRVSTVGRASHVTRVCWECACPLCWQLRNYSVASACRMSPCFSIHGRSVWAPSRTRSSRRLGCSGVPQTVPQLLLCVILGFDILVLVGR